MPGPLSPRVAVSSVRSAHRRLRWVPVILMAGGLLGLAPPGLAARSVEIIYHNDVWPCEPKQGIQFLSQTDGWVGVYGAASARGKPHQPYLLGTGRGAADLQPVRGLQLPADHALKSFVFLDLQFGWVVGSQMKAGGGQTRLWRTRDGGKTWEELTHNLPTGGLRQIQFVSPIRGWGLLGKVWRTDDGGTTWQQLSQPPERESGFTRMLFLNSSDGWVIGRGTIHQTPDGGETWILRYDSRPARHPWLWSIQFPSRTEGWVAGDGKFLLHTADGGQTWQPVHPRHRRMGPFDAFNTVHFLSPQIGVITAQHHERETVSKAVRRRLSPVAMGYYRPYLLATFDGGRNWSYHDLPIPVGQWSQAAPNLLYGINTVDATHEATGIVEVRITPPSVKSPKR